MKKIFLILAILFFSSSAFAHPLGSESFGQRLLVEIYPEHLEAFYVLEMPTSFMAKEVIAFQREHGEGDQLFKEKMLRDLQKNLVLLVNGMQQGWQRDQNFSDNTGKGDLNFFEYRIRLISALPDQSDGADYNIEIKNENFVDKESAYLVGMIAENGIRFIDSNIPESLDWNRDNSFRNLISNFQIDQSLDSVTRIGSAALPEEKEDLLSQFFAAKPSKTFTFLALVTAFLLGLAHAFEPGHGKALVGAYLVGARGNYYHAVMLGLIVTLTHIGSILIIALLVFYVIGNFVPEEIAPYMSLFSGLMIVVIGGYLFVRRLRELRGKESHHHHHHDTKSLVALGISGGIVPCPTALAIVLVAISMDRFFWGLGLILAFSLGLAIVLISLGCLFVGASGLVKRIDVKGRKWQIVAFLSSIVVIGVGIAIVYSALEIL